MSEGLIVSGEAIRRIGCSASALDHWRRTNVLRAVKGGPLPKSPWLYDERDVEKIAESYGALRRAKGVCEPVGKEPC